MAENKKQYKTAIFLMGGGLVNDAGVWRTTNYDEGDKFGIIGDRAVVVAAGFLYQDEPEQLCVAAGGRGQDQDIKDAPPVSAVLKQELIKLGVLNEDIMEENNSGNTYQQLRELQNIWQAKNFTQAALISNQHGLARIEAMIEYKIELAHFKDLLRVGRLKLLSAEEILLERAPAEWGGKIKRAYASEAMKKRIALEERGARQIK